MNKSSQSYEMSLAIIAQCYLPSGTSEHTRRNPSQTDQYLICVPKGMEGWVYLHVTDQLHIPRWFTRPQMVTHPSTNLAVHGWVLNSRPVDHESDALTTALLLCRECFACCTYAGVDSERLARHGATEINQVHRSTLGHWPCVDWVFPLLVKRRGEKYCTTNYWPTYQHLSTTGLAQLHFVQLHLQLNYNYTFYIYSILEVQYYS